MRCDIDLLEAAIMDPSFFRSSIRCQVLLLEWIYRLYKTLTSREDIVFMRVWWYPAINRAVGRANMSIGVIQYVIRDIFMPILLIMEDF